MYGVTPPTLWSVVEVSALCVRISLQPLRPVHPAAPEPVCASLHPAYIAAEAAAAISTLAAACVSASCRAEVGWRRLSSGAVWGCLCLAATRACCRACYRGEGTCNNSIDERERHESGNEAPNPSAYTKQGLPGAAALWHINSCARPAGAIGRRSRSTACCSSLPCSRSRG